MPQGVFFLTSCLTNWGRFADYLARRKREEAAGGDPSTRSGEPVMNEGGKGFGGGEATRDPEPTQIDPNDPKGKQQAIHKAESFALAS